MRAAEKKMTLEYLELMEDLKEEKKAVQPRRVRGTAIFHADNSMEFQPQGEGQPVQRSVRKRGESRFYETQGEKASSYICHLKVGKDCADPAAEMEEQLDYFLKGMRKKEPGKPRGKRLMECPELTVYHNRQKCEVTVLMTIDLKQEGELSAKLFNLTSEVNKCFAINRKDLLA